MPTYQYECEACGHLFEQLQSMIDKKLKKCPQCAKMMLVRHIGGGSGIIFKGSGFYATDYKKKDPANDELSRATPVSPASPSVGGGGHCHSGGCGCASPVKSETKK